METIYITGFSGVGKSMVGKLLSSRKDLKFLDTNRFIEEKENKTIQEIFNEKGNDYIKSLERDTLYNNVEQGMIVTLGTYIPKDDDNRKKIKTSGRVIYLRAKANTIYENLKEEHNKKPSLKNDFSIFTVENKLADMKPYYEDLANYIIDVDGKKLNTVFREALAIYNFCNRAKIHIYIK